MVSGTQNASFLFTDCIVNVMPLVISRGPGNKKCHWTLQDKSEKDGSSWDLACYWAKQKYRDLKPQDLCFAKRWPTRRSESVPGLELATKIVVNVQEVIKTKYLECEELRHCHGCFNAQQQGLPDEPGLWPWKWSRSSHVLGLCQVNKSVTPRRDGADTRSRALGSQTGNWTA